MVVDELGKRKRKAEEIQEEIDVLMSSHHLPQTAPVYSRILQNECQLLNSLSLGDESAEADPHASLVKNAVDHPAHYNTGKFEVIDVIEDWGLGFHDGNTVKYVARARHKGNELEDLKKALWYLTRRIQVLEASCQK